MLALRTIWNCSVLSGVNIWSGGRGRDWRKNNWMPAVYFARLRESYRCARTIIVYQKSFRLKISRHDTHYNAQFDREECLLKSGNAHVKNLLEAEKHSMEYPRYRRRWACDYLGFYNFVIHWMNVGNCHNKRIAHICVWVYLCQSQCVIPIIKLAVELNL